MRGGGELRKSVRGRKGEGNERKGREREGKEAKGKVLEVVMEEAERRGHKRGGEGRVRGRGGGE